MKKLIVGILAGLLMLSLGGIAQASIIYDADVSPGIIFGTGNSNGYFAVDSTDDIQVGLRAKVAYQGIYNSDGAGTYTFLTGAHSKWGSPGALWNYEFSINVDLTGTTDKTFSDYIIRLSVDMDPGAGYDWFVFDPLSFSDNAITDDSLAQNSMNIGWLSEIGATTPFDNSVIGTYDFKLSVSEVNGDAPLVETMITVNVVPEPATMALFGFGLLGLAGISRRKQA